MQDILSAVTAVTEEIEERVLLPIRLSPRPRDYVASACLLAFMGCFWVYVFALSFFIQSLHLR